MPMMTMPTAVMSDLSDSAPTRPTARPHMKTAEARMTTEMCIRDRYKKQAAQQPKDKQKEHKKDLEV